MTIKAIFGFALFVILGSACLSACGAIAGEARLSEESLKTSPRDSIAYQFQLLKEGNATRLKECFTQRQRDGVTPEAVEKGKAQAGKYTIDDLVGSIEPFEAEGRKAVKVKMKNGRTLTTLIESDGKWLADTLWFR